MKFTPGQRVTRKKADEHSLLPKGGSYTVSACTDLVLVLAEFPQYVLPIADFELV